MTRPEIKILASFGPTVCVGVDMFAEAAAAFAGSSVHQTRKYQTKNSAECDAVYEYAAAHLAAGYTARQLQAAMVQRGLNHELDANLLKEFHD